MKGICTALLILIIAASSPAQTKVALVGTPVEYASMLQSILGSNYEVKSVYTKDEDYLRDQFFKSREFAAVLAFHANIVVETTLGDPRESTKVDAFEPALREGLVKLRGLDGNTKVYLWIRPEQTTAPGDDAGWNLHYENYLRPLAIQAAREAGVGVIEHEIERPTFGVGERREAVEYIAETLAPATIKAHWRIVRASSFQADEGPPQNAIDGDPDTFWHSEYDPKLAKPPHEIVLDLGESQWLTGFKYLPRQDGGVNGNVKDYEIYVGDSADSQPTLAAKGTFRDGRNQKIARFRSSVKARYVRFVCLSEESGGPFASAAELDVIRDPGKN